MTRTTSLDITASPPVHAHFLDWGVIQISWANLIVVVLMLLVFTLAVVVPFPHGRDDADLQDARDVQA